MLSRACKACRACSNIRERALSWALCMQSMPLNACTAPGPILEHSLDAAQACPQKLKEPQARMHLSRCMDMHSTWSQPSHIVGGTEKAHQCSTWRVCRYSAALVSRQIRPHITSTGVAAQTASWGAVRDACVTGRGSGREAETDSPVQHLEGVQVFCRAQQLAEQALGLILRHASRSPEQCCDQL